MTIAAFVASLIIANVGWYMLGRAAGKRQLAHTIRREIIGGHAPYWALNADLVAELPGWGGFGCTAQEVRDEVRPVFDEIEAVCDNALGVQA